MDLTTSVLAPVRLTMANNESSTVPELRLVLLGSVDEGKRSAGNTILGREVFSSQKTMECVSKKALVAGRQVTVINTPGWGREQRLKLTPINVRDQLLQSVFPPGVDALVLVIRSDRKFTEANRVALQDHMELLGENVWVHTMVLFTCGDWLGGTSIEEFIYSEGAALQWVVDKCEYKYSCINNSERADITQVSDMLANIEELAKEFGRFHLDEERYKKEVESMIAQQKAVEEMQQRRWGIKRPPQCQSKDSGIDMSSSTIKVEPKVASQKHHMETGMLN